MPVVPRYSEPQVREQGLPGVRITPSAPIEAFGGGDAVAGVFKAAQGAGDVMQKYAAEEKKKADQLAVLDADKKLSEMETRLLYDPQMGALNKKGRDSFGLPDQVMGEFGKGVQEIEKSLNNDEQRMQFRRSAISRQVDIDRQIQKHVSGEIRQYDSTVTESYLANERDAASANYHDPERVGMSIARQRAALLDHANRNGLPPEWVNLKVTESASKTHTGVISRMLANGEDLAAKQYYDANRESISGADATHLEKSLEEGTLRGESQRQSDAIMNRGLPMADSLKAAKAIKDPKVRDAVVSRVEHEFSARQAAERQDREDAYKTVWTTLEQTKEMPPNDANWAKLNPSEKHSIETRLAQLKAGLPRVTDPNTYYELYTLASSPVTRDQFLQMNLMEKHPKLSDQDFQEIVKLQSQLRKGDAQADLKLDGYRTNAQIVDGTLAQAGFDTTPKPGSDDATQVNQFRKTVDDKVVALQKSTGRPATNKEVQEIVDGLIIEGRVSGTGLFGFFQTKRRVFQQQPGEQLEFEAKDIPAAERSKIESALRQRGVPVTDERVSQLYAAKMRKSSGQ